MNKKLPRLIFSSLMLVIGIYALVSPQTGYSKSKSVHIIQLDDDTINPVTSDYISSSIDKAYAEEAECLIIKLDTPGGLLSSTRTIVKKMLTAKLPVIVYISPSGSRAGSAGVFITYASHVAAMAPSTNIGAAHPVNIGGQKSPGKENDWSDLKELINELKKTQQKQIEDMVESGGKEVKKSESKEVDKSEDSKDIIADQNPLQSKILQDTVAFIKAIATERNRNVEWAIKSVTKSLSITSDEALEKGVVEIIAKNDQDLLEQLDGRTVNVNGQIVTLSTKDVVIETHQMEFRQSLFNVLANPNIAYILMLLGFYGLMYEITHPGFGVPGVLGIVFLIIAFYSMQTLPTNYAGLALIIVGLCLLIAEAYIPGFGVLTLGGLICMILGSMLLFESVDPIMQVSKSAIFGFSFTTAGITFILVRSVLKSMRSKVRGGQEGLLNEIGKAREIIKAGKEGNVFIHGEIWKAEALENIEKNEKIVVEKVDGLLLKIRKQTDQKEN